MLTDVVFWCILVPYMSSAHFSVNLVSNYQHFLEIFLFRLFLLSYTSDGAGTLPVLAAY